MLNPLSFNGLATGQRGVHLRLIETTDLHLHLLPYDYYADRPWAGVGLASAARLIEAARAEAPNSLLFDNGDFLQGTPMGDYVAQERGLRAGDLHPIMAAMNALNYDAITLGNHEFNYGLDFLLRTLQGARFPVVSSNLMTRRGSDARADRTLVKPYVLLDRLVADENGYRHPLRIGVIGFAPPQVVDWDNHALDGRLQARDIVETAQAWVPEMREAGADIVVALAHTGIGAARITGTSTRRPRACSAQARMIARSPASAPRHSAAMNRTCPRAGPSRMRPSNVLLALKTARFQPGRAAHTSGSR